MATHQLKQRAKKEFCDVRNYECTICDVSYSNPDLLSAHIDAHVNERSHNESSNEQKKIIIEYECSSTMVPSRILSVSKEREVIVIDGHEYRRCDKDAEETSKEGHEEVRETIAFEGDQEFVVHTTENQPIHPTASSSIQNDPATQNEISEPENETIREPTQEDIIKIENEENDIEIVDVFQVTQSEFRKNRVETKIEIAAIDQREESNNLQVEMQPMNVSADTVKITRIDLPNDFLPEGLEDFDALDSQDSAERPAVEKSPLKIRQLSEESEKVGNNLKCPICDKVFQSEISLKKHKVKKHLECNTCQKKFKLKCHLTRHKNLVHENAAEKDFECESCDMKFKRKDHLNRHKKSAHENALEENFECESRDMKFKRKEHLTRHKMLAHENAEKNFECESCDRKFKRKDLLLRHQMMLHENGLERKFECRFCDKKFALKVFLANHARSHRGKSHKDIARKDDVENVQGKKFECDTCQKKFKRENHLSLHKKLAHENVTEKKFECESCDKKFARKCHLARHMKCHRGKSHKDLAQKANVENVQEKKFECNTCEKKFKRKNNLSLHKMLTHPAHENVIESDDKKVSHFKCEICNKGFTRKDNAIKHVKYVHKKFKDPKCDLCDKSVRKEYLNEHMLQSHGATKSDHSIPLKSCDFCDKKFTRIGFLNQHVRNVHFRVKKEYVAKN